MTDEELINGLRQNALWVTTHDAADRIEALIKEKDQWIAHAKNAVWTDSEELKLAEERVEELTASLSNMASLFAKEAAEKQVAIGEVEANQKERDSFYEDAMHHIALWGETLTEKSKVEAELKSAKLRIEVLQSVCRGLSDQLMVAQAEIAKTLGVGNG